MTPSMRRKARRLALQAVYQWHISAGEIKDIDARLRENCNPKKVDCDYFSTLIAGVVENIEKLDNAMEPILDRPIAEVNPIELSILRIALYELIYRLDIPYKVIINEALELAKMFGAEESYKYINGVLDKIAKRRIDYEKRNTK